MKAIRRILGAASILIALLTASCNNDYGIFKNVQEEKQQVGTTVFQEVPVMSAFRCGGYYYAAIATLQRSVVGQDSWSKVAIGNPPSTSYVLSSAVCSGPTGTIYALVQTGTEPNITVKVYSSTDGNTWTALTGLPTQTYNSSTVNVFDALFITSKGDLYAENHNYDLNPTDPSTPGASVYTLYYYKPSSSSFVQVKGGDGGFSPSPTSDYDKSIRGVVSDANGKYWFASEDSLYGGGTDPAGADAVNSLSSFYPGFASIIPNATTIWAISCTGGTLTGSPGRFVYISTKNGNIYRNDGTENNPTSIPLWQVFEVPSSTAPLTTLIVGTDAVGITAASGYFEGTWNNLSNGGSNVSFDIAGGEAIYSTTVQNFPVLSFYYDSSGYTDPATNLTFHPLFVCIVPGYSSTTYHGLYQSIWNGSSWSGWSAQ